MIGAAEITLPTVGSSQNLINENYKVDVNRGCLIRIHSGSGAAVYMFWDQPGIFYNDHAKKIPPEFAAEAGFDVEPLLKARRKQEALLKAHQEIEAQYKEDLGTREIVAEAEEYRLIHIGDKRYIVEFEDGSRLTPTPVSEEMATRTFRSLVGQAEPTTEPKTKK